MKLRPVAIASTLFVTLSEMASAGVIVVDAGGGGDFTAIQSAITAAVDGDTILVKPGTYVGFTISGKELTIVGDDVGTWPNLTGISRVETLALGKVVTLARLQSTGPDSGTLQIDDCLGAVRVTSCEFEGRSATFANQFPGSGANVTESNDVAFTGSVLRGGDGLSNPVCESPSTNVVNANYGLRVWNSSVASYECAIDGGHGANGGSRTGRGGEGVFVQHVTDARTAAFFFASRSNIHAGDGGNTDCNAWGCARTGGDGVWLDWGTFTMAGPTKGWFLDLMVSGGAAGVWTNGTSGGCDPALPGAAYAGEPGFTFGVASLGFTIPAVAHEGEFVTVTFTGLPGAQVFLNDELTTTFQAVASWRGILLSPFPEAQIGPARSRRWGTIPASEVLTAQYRVPMLPPGVEAQTRFLQAYRIGPNGITLGTFRTLTVLDSAF
jgi:hypothetical protein